MSFLKAACVAASLSLCTMTQAGAETVLDGKGRKDLTLTIYQNGLGFVRDERRVALDKGNNRVVFEDVSTELIPDSLLISGSGFQVSERRFAFDVLDAHTLLARSEGKVVAFRKMNSVTGQDEIITAKVISAKGPVVIERDGRIEVGQPGSLVVSHLPQGMRMKPALLATLSSEKKRESDLQLAYLTNGVKWYASYSVELDATGENMVLKAWANLTNTSGQDFLEAHLALAAGQLNRQTVPSPQPMLARNVMAKTMMAADGAVESVGVAAPQAVGAIHLYKLPGVVDFNRNETQQIALMQAQKLKVERRLVQRFSPVYGRMNLRSDQTLHPQVEIEFSNDSAQPFPDGVVRLYRNDAKGDVQFVGEDRLKQTPVKAKAKLHPGQSFDVTLERSQTDFDLKDKNHFEAAYDVIISNAKKTQEKVRVIDRFPGEWSLKDNSHKPTRQSDGEVQWDVSVPAGGKVTLSYRVDVRTR